MILYLFFSPKTDEFAEADLLTKVMQRGYITVGVNPDSKPFAFYDSQGNLTGYDVDLANYIAEYIVKDKSRARFAVVSPSNRLIKVSTGEVDMVISTVTITPQRLEVVDFSKPYETAGQVLLVRSTSTVSSLQDLAGQTIGVIFGTTAERNIQRLAPTARIQGFRTYPEAYNALKTGQIFAVTSDDTILNQYAIKDKGVKILPRRYSVEPYGVAFKKGSTSERLRVEVDYALKDLRRRGILKSLHEKWGLGSEI